MIKCAAFDCFGTVFDTAALSPDLISDYVRHVRSTTFSPYTFPPAWHDLPAHPDATEGILMLRKSGIACVALSNGTPELIRHLSRRAEILWDCVIDLAAREVYKPHLDAYRAVEAVFGPPPEETMMVTANPTFGDVEGAVAVGMQAWVIRHGYPNTIIELAEMFLQQKVSDD
jgi:2-haloalkanoic acid dehalogenase type II